MPTLKNSKLLHFKVDICKNNRIFNINTSTPQVQTLHQKRKAVEANQWQKENIHAIEAYNKNVEENGCFSDDYRSF